VVKPTEYPSDRRGHTHYRVVYFYTIFVVAKIPELQLIAGFFPEKSIDELRQNIFLVGNSFLLPVVAG
jgi:hypothetical protein